MFQICLFFVFYLSLMSFIHSIFKVFISITKMLITKWATSEAVGLLHFARLVARLATFHDPWCWYCFNFQTHFHSIICILFLFLKLCFVLLLNNGIFFLSNNNILWKHRWLLVSHNGVKRCLYHTRAFLFTFCRQLRR